METPDPVRQNATCSILYKIDLMRCCRHKKHEQRMGPDPDFWYRDLGKAVERYSLWFHQTGHLIWFGDIADCCYFKVLTKIEKYD